MHPGSVQTFYQPRRLILIAACAAPVILLLIVWWAVTQFFLVPAVPDDDASPEAIARFLIHEKGLPRLAPRQAEQVFRRQARRLAADPPLRDRFLRQIRIASPEQQRQLRRHVMDFLKDVLISDIREYHQRPADAQLAYLDERIIDYNRLRNAFGETDLSPDLVGVLQPSKAEAWDWLMNHTTPEERQLLAEFRQLLVRRIEQILADPELEAEIRRRIDERS
jgi:hypothetical protein